MYQFILLIQIVQKLNIFYYYLHIKLIVVFNLIIIVLPSIQVYHNL